jgi:DNA-binding HxlR family transcriptional regulator
MTPTRKSFQQRCPMANALDVVGERWTLLILRELLGGPARYNDLLAGLPGIARNLLSLRLKRLEEDGVVRRVSAGSTTLYALTELGAGARPALEALGFWGARLPRLEPPVHGRSLRATAMALQAILRHAGHPLPESPVVVELAVDNEPLEIVLGPKPTATVRPCQASAAHLGTTAAVMEAYLNGTRPEPDAFTLLAGSPTARAALLVALGLPAPA